MTVAKPVIRRSAISPVRLVALMSTHEYRVVPVCLVPASAHGSVWLPVNTGGCCRVLVGACGYQLTRDGEVRVGRMLRVVVSSFSVKVRPNLLWQVEVPVSS